MEEITIDDYYIRVETYTHKDYPHYGSDHTTEPIDNYGFSTRIKAEEIFYQQRLNIWNEWMELDDNQSNEDEYYVTRFKGYKRTMQRGFKVLYEGGETYHDDSKTFVFVHKKLKRIV